jgi:hypothetical protein
MIVMNEKERQDILTATLKDFEKIYGQRNIRVISVPINPFEDPSTAQMRKAMVSRFFIEEISKTGYPQFVMDEGGLVFPRQDHYWQRTPPLCWSMPTEQAITDAYKEIKARHLEEGK